MLGTAAPRPTRPHAQAREGIAAFLNELLLYSGQYALFYVLMNFSADGWDYFTNLGHSLLLLILIGQTIFLVGFGGKPLLRFLGSMIAPFCYTLIELREGMDFVLNSGHMFFWIFSSVTGVLQAWSISTKSQSAKRVVEFIITAVNVSIFLFVYYYFDLRLAYESRLSAKEITEEVFRNYLRITRTADGLRVFLQDPAHVYVILGGAVLGITLGVGRVKILMLKDRINALFGTYVDKDIRDRIIGENRGRSEKREICVLFSDIRDFTPLSETHSAAEITGMLNLYFTQWDKLVVKHGGVIDKFVGDAIMVLFGLKNRADACQSAVACATEMIDNLDTVKALLRQKQLPVIADIGIGINFGDAIIGDIGSEDRKNYTAIGDNVNVAARLESLCKQYKVPIAVSKDVHERIHGQLKERFVFLDLADLKGRTDKVEVYSHRQVG